MLQAVSAAFFVGDVLADYMAIGLDPHTNYEALATLALVLGVVYGSVEMWRTVSRQLLAEGALRLAAGAFAELIAERFGAWALSPAEAEVALLTLKGFDSSEIAKLRNTADGTVRVQLANIYAKSGKQHPLDRETGMGTQGK
jgi:DNA-binding CsgD family transcriptional regulator